MSLKSKSIYLVEAFNPETGDNIRSWRNSFGTIEEAIASDIFRDLPAVIEEYVFNDDNDEEPEFIDVIAYSPLFAFILMNDPEESPKVLI